MTSLVIAACGTVLLVAGLVTAPQHVAASYVVAYAATLAVVLGMLLLVGIARLSGAIWFVPFAPLADAAAGALPVLGILALPLVAHQPGPVIARAGVYWMVWLSVGEALALRRTPAVDTVAVIGVTLTATLAAIDWMMSMSPDWSSTVYGPYYCMGGLLSALALLAVVPPRALARHRILRPTAEHRHALGRLAVAFILFWAYLWYAQFFIIWIADIPREVTWYVTRLRGGWGVLATVMLVSGFAVPLATLFFRLAKRSASIMPAIGVLLLAAHYLDVYWVVVPALRSDWQWSYLAWDLGGLAAIAGWSWSFAVWRVRRFRPVILSGALLRSSVGYEAH